MTLAALCTIGRLHHIAAEPASLVHQLGLSESDPIRTEDLLRGAKLLGLKAKLSQSTCERLPLNPLPALALMHGGQVVVLAQFDGQRVLYQASGSAILNTPPDQRSPAATRQRPHCSGQRDVPLALDADPAIVHALGFRGVNFVAERAHQAFLLSRFVTARIAFEVRALAKASVSGHKSAGTGCEGARSWICAYQSSGDCNNTFGSGISRLASAGTTICDSGETLGASGLELTNSGASRKVRWRLHSAEGRRRNPRQGSRRLHLLTECPIESPL